MRGLNMHLANIQSTQNIESRWKASLVWLYEFTFQGAILMLKPCPVKWATYAALSMISKRCCKTCYSIWNCVQKFSLNTKVCIILKSNPNTVSSQIHISLYNILELWIIAVSKNTFMLACTPRLMNVSYCQQAFYFQNQLIMWAFSKN